MELNPKHIVNLDGKVAPHTLAHILGINVSLIYQEKAKGAFGSPQVAFTEQTYLDCFRLYRTYHAKNTEAKLAKVAAELEINKLKLENHKEYKEKKLSFETSEIGDKLSELQIKQIEQRIKTDKVTEIKNWLFIAETRDELLVAEELRTLFEPFIHLIKNNLISVAMEFPDVRPKIDETLNDLADIGQRMLKQVGEDRNDFVDEMMKKTIDDDFIELQFVPQARKA